MFHVLIDTSTWHVLAQNPKRTLLLLAGREHGSPEVASPDGPSRSWWVSFTRTVIA